MFGALGCAGCHAGPAYTDRALHALRDRPAMATPSLRGVAITGPYLVDGSVPTLEALIDAAPALGKGDTAALDAEDRAALLAYLRSL